MEKNTQKRNTKIKNFPAQKLIDEISCQDGYFFLTGVNVYGFCYSSSYGGKCIDFISHNEKGNQWYLETAEIIQEMIEWVLKQPDPNKYYFHWSG